MGSAVLGAGRGGPVNRSRGTVPMSALNDADVTPAPCGSRLRLRRRLPGMSSPVDREAFARGQQTRLTCVFPWRSPLYPQCQRYPHGRPHFPQAARFTGAGLSTASRGRQVARSVELACRSNQGAWIRTRSPQRLAGLRDATRPRELSCHRGRNYSDVPRSGGYRLDLTKPCRRGREVVVESLP